MKELIPLFESYMVHCQYEKNLSQHSLKAYKQDFNQFLSFTQSECNQEQICITSIDKFLLKKYVVHLGSQHKIKSVKRKIATIKSFLNYLEFEDIISVNPFRKMKLRLKEPVTLPKVMTLSEIKKIFKNAYKQLSATSPDKKYSCLATHRDIAILELLFGTGIRVSELCSLRVCDVNLRHRFIVVHGKGNKERLIHICNDEILHILNVYDKLIDREIPDRDYFFLNRLKKRFSEQSVRFMIRKYVRSSNISKKITPHTFRHTFATLLLEAGVDIKYIQNLLGHTSIVTTQIYTHVNKEKQRKILNAKHPRKNFSMITEARMNKG